MTRLLRGVQVTFAFWIIGFWLTAGSVGWAQGRTMLLGLSFSSDSRYIATCGDRVRVFEVATGKRLKEIDEPWKNIEVSREIAFSPTDPGLLVVGSHSGQIRVLKLGQAEPVHKLEGHDGMTSSLAFAKDGKSLATSSVQYIQGKAAFGKLRYWDVGSGRLLHSEDRDDAGIDALSISDDGTQIAFCTKADFEVYDTTSWTQIGSVTLPAGNLQGEPFGLETAFGKDDGFVVIAGGICVPSGGGCRTTGLLWKLELNGSVTLMGGPRAGYCRSVNFTPDRTRFVTGHQNGPGHQVLMSDLDSGDIVWTAARDGRGGLPEPFGVRISPDGKLVAWCVLGQIRVVDAANGEEVRTLELAD